MKVTLEVELPTHPDLPASSACAMAVAVAHVVEGAMRTGPWSKPPLTRLVAVNYWPGQMP